ncbi:MAG: type II toxin-antitoxin system PemK/MazF family toxin [Saprospiraceae bacterium]|nr:type II toxin-antitoxin system PemK/MazF family toxin [Saprospiraceae bacterium]
MKAVKQGEIWYADLNPVKGNEQAGLRPVIIVSGNLANSHLNMVICCPLTTKVKNFRGNVVLMPPAVNGLIDVSEILTFHIRSITKDRLISKIGYVDKSQLQLVKQGFDDIWRY